MAARGGFSINPVIARGRTAGGGRYEVTWRMRQREEAARQAGRSAAFTAIAKGYGPIIRTALRRHARSGATLRSLRMERGSKGVDRFWNVSVPYVAHAEFGHVGRGGAKVRGTNALRGVVG